MAESSVVFRKWDRPVRFQFRQTGTVRNTTIAAASGHWNHCDVWLVADLAWFTSAVQLVVFAKQGAARVRVAVVALDLLARADADTARAMVRAAGVRGIPCDGFEVEVQGFAGAIGTADVYLECWGCEDTGGSVTGTGGPSGGVGSPFQAYIFDPTLAAWVPLQGTQALGARVNETQAPVAENNTDGVIYNSPRAIASSTGAWSRLANPQTAVGTAGESVKSTPGRVRQVRAHNIGVGGFYMCLVDKASAAVNGDSIYDRVWVPNGTTGVLEYGDDGIYLPTGISLAFSSTPATVTLLGTNDALRQGRWL